MDQGPRWCYRSEWNCDERKGIIAGGKKIWFRGKILLLASKNGFGSFTSISIFFWNSLRIGINSSLNRIPLGSHPALDFLFVGTFFHVFYFLILQ